MEIQRIRNDAYSATSAVRLQGAGKHGRSEGSQTVQFELTQNKEPKPAEQSIPSPKEPMNLMTRMSPDSTVRVNEKRKDQILPVDAQKTDGSNQQKVEDSSQFKRNIAATQYANAMKNKPSFLEASVPGFNTDIKL